ncbi:Hypothetical predicted protein [Paramuricea clavata]|uniref:Transposable element P transposase-like GTP-binding insertion domain-containing protein n=1 Tax=Paramuricea clavata TaxID=317549 RepID=A0A6S7LB33_PARCT|nr:Hypothetical predicted protein [Paramuricea clavata]
MEMAANQLSGTISNCLYGTGIGGELEATSDILPGLEVVAVVRNNLINYDYHCEEKVAASWRHQSPIRYNIDSKNHIRCCPKLTNKHIFPNGFQMMKVKYAAQVLSNTVSAAVLMAINGGLPPDATEKAEIRSTFDEIFDFLNSSSFKSYKIHNRPITSESKHPGLMKECVHFSEKLPLKIQQLMKMLHPL